MSQHTPGPWTYDKTVDEFHFFINAPTLASMCCVRDEANARLIAAAPELLQALGNLVANEHGAESVKAICYREARAALELARGGCQQGLHEWGIDGAHSNEYCKRCFMSRAATGENNENA